MNPTYIILSERARPKSYLLLDSIYMILWKRHASGDRKKKKMDQ